MSTVIEQCVQNMCEFFNTKQDSKSFKYTKLKSYYRIFTEVKGSKMKDPPQRSAYCFVKVTDGSIWKPSGWAGPSLNFARGNVQDPATYKLFSIHGI